MEHAHRVRNLTIAILVTMGILGGILLMQRSSTSLLPDATKIRVTASFYPLGDFARAVGGEYASVSIITPSGAEPHEYEPSPKDIALIHSSRIFLYEGLLEPWPDKVLPNLQRDTVIIRMTDYVNDKIDSDPHAWLDPMIAKSMVKKVSEAFKQVDPVHAEAYEVNASRYMARLDALDAVISRSLDTCKHQTIIVSHNAFQYLARRYGLKTEYIAGLSPEEEPSPRQIAEIASLAKNRQVRYIFFETLVSPKLAQTVAAEAGAQILVLDPIEGLSAEDSTIGIDYIGLMERNLTSLRTALECQQ